MRKIFNFIHTLFNANFKKRSNQIIRLSLTERKLKELNISVEDGLEIQDNGAMLQELQEKSEVNKSLELIVDKIKESSNYIMSQDDFSKLFKKNKKLMKSKPLRKLALELINNGSEITSYGKAWSIPKGNWIYFSNYLDIKKIEKKHNFESHIVVHKNEDKRTGLELGFFDERTEEAIMGRYKN